MLLSTNTNLLARKYGNETAIKMIAEAGFDAYDMSFFDMLNNENDPFNGDDYIEYARSLRRVADEAGIVCNQGHAPFGSSTGEAERDEFIFGRIVRSMEIASILGAKIIIVHPCQHLTYCEEGNREKLKEINMDFYRRLIPYCESFGIKVAAENMWQWSDRFGKIMPSTCSFAEEFVDYIDSVNSEWIVACLDIGHTPLVGESIERMIKMLGKKRLQALHVHDVDGKSDLHTLPYMSKIDWQSAMKTLGEIGYEGDLTFEAGNFITKMPPELWEAAHRFMEATGRCLISLTGL